MTFLVPTANLRYQIMPSPLQGFDQVIAMTQAHVNATIDIRFRLDPKNLCLDVEGDWGTISSEMDPPIVSFYIPSEIQKVHFCVNLASCKCSWYKLNHTVVIKQKHDDLFSLSIYNTKS